MTGSTTTKTSSATEPWKQAQPYLTGALGSAGNLYNSGQGFNPYPNSTVADMSSQTQGALGGMYNMLNQNANRSAALKMSTVPIYQERERQLPNLVRAQHTNAILQALQNVAGINSGGATDYWGRYGFNRDV